MAAARSGCHRFSVHKAVDQLAAKLVGIELSTDKNKARFARFAFCPRSIRAAIDCHVNRLKNKPSVCPGKGDDAFGAQ